MGFEELIHYVNTDKVYGYSVGFCNGVFNTPSSSITFERVRELHGAFSEFAYRASNYRTEFEEKVKGLGNSETLRDEVFGSEQGYKEALEEFRRRRDTFLAVRRQVGTYIYRFMCKASPLSSRLSPEMLKELFGIADPVLYCFEEWQVIKMFNAITYNEAEAIRW